MDSEYKELQSRIERADSLVEVLQKKFEIECRQSESGGGDIMNSFAEEFLKLFYDPNKPYKLHHCQEENGLLSDIQDDAEGLHHSHHPGQER